jgi:hypothetical protein
MTAVSIQKLIIRTTKDYPLIGEVVTNEGAKAIRLREAGTSYVDTKGRVFSKQTGKRPGDSMTGVFLRMETVRGIT